VKSNITFHTFVTHSSNITHCIKRDVKHEVHQVERMQTDSHKVCSKCPPLARTQARKRTGHWSTASSVSDSFKPRHTCSRRCRSSPVSSTWQSRHIYITCKINKQIPYLQRAFIPVCSYVKNIKIHQGFPQLWSKIYCHVFYEAQCTYIESCLVLSCYLQVYNIPTLQPALTCSLYFRVTIYTIVVAETIKLKNIYGTLTECLDGCMWLSVPVIHPFTRDVAFCRNKNFAQIYLSNCGRQIWLRNNWIRRLNEIARQTL